MLLADVGQDEPMAGHPSPPAQQSSELVGQLARELSTLVRGDIEVAGSERLPTLRRALLDALAVAVVAAAALFALAAASFAAGRVAALVLPGMGHLRGRRRGLGLAASTSHDHGLKTRSSAHSCQQ